MDAFLEEGKRASYNLEFGLTSRGGIDGNALSQAQKFQTYVNPGKFWEENKYSYLLSQFKLDFIATDVLNQVGWNLV